MQLSSRGLASHEQSFAMTALGSSTLSSHDSLLESQLLLDGEASAFDNTDVDDSFFTGYLSTLLDNNLRQEVAAGNVPSSGKPLGCVVHVWQQALWHAMHLSLK